MASENCSKCGEPIKPMRGDEPASEWEHHCAAPSRGEGARASDGIMAATRQEFKDTLINDYNFTPEAAESVLEPQAGEAGQPPACDCCGAGPMLDRGGFYDCFACGHNREKDDPPAPQGTAECVKLIRRVEAACQYCHTDMIPYSDGSYYCEACNLRILIEDGIKENK